MLMSGVLSFSLYRSAAAHHAIGVASPFGRGFERIERHHQPPRGGVDFSIDRLGVAGPVGVTITHEIQRVPSRKPAAQQNQRFGKRLDA